jgi:hypothetical protein
MFIQLSSFVRKVTSRICSSDGNTNVYNIFVGTYWKVSTWQSKSDGRKISNEILTKLDIRLWIMMCPLVGFGIRNIDAGRVC